MLQLRKQVDSANARISELESELEAAVSREYAVRLTILAATWTRDELIEHAESDAKSIVGEARREALMLTTETRKETDRLLGEGKVDVFPGTGSLIQTAGTPGHRDRLVACSGLRRPATGAHQGAVRVVELFVENLHRGDR